MQSATEIATEVVTSPSWLRGAGEGVHRAGLAHLDFGFPWGEQTNLPLEGLSRGREAGQGSSLLSLNAQLRAPPRYHPPLQITTKL